MLVETSVSKRAVSLAILVSALGYFVDVYDIIVFNILRVPSLKALGLSEEEIFSSGVSILNCQMAGMLVGGVIWGILGDKRGRIQVLFGSILVYSLASIANAFVQTVPQYQLLRFVAGIGLAGEIGAGITLVSELVPKESRGLATMVVAAVGVSGAVAAGLVAEITTWQNAYLIGGVMGMLLLAFRLSVRESVMFRAVERRINVRRGDLFLLFADRDRCARYFYCILAGLPIWYVGAVLLTFAPEVCAALEISEQISVSRIFMVQAIGMTLGDVLSGVLSQYMRSRRRVIGIFLVGVCVTSWTLLSARQVSISTIYAIYFFLGLGMGYWAVFVTITAEQFGTNLRATATTTIPNFVRGMAIPMTLAFQWLATDYGVLAAAEIVGMTVLALAAVAVCRIRETFGIDLDYLERPGFSATESDPR